MFCPDCGAENSKGQKFCTRCGTNLIAIERAREIVSEIKANISAPPVETSTILKIVALISAIGILAITGGTVALMPFGGPIPVFFALGGFTSLVMICYYLLQLIKPSARTEMSRQAPPVGSATHGVASATNRELGGSPTPYRSIIEETTQHFESERRA
ncbi:MAG: zinc-ribbon domain-containing protein [Chloracidobacterium sp.]|nr:zinc-ribbon domain-containing protein [Chloracidobacterium sp.]